MRVAGVREIDSFGIVAELGLVGEDAEQLCSFWQSGRARTSRPIAVSRPGSSSITRALGVDGLVDLARARLEEGADLVEESLFSRRRRRDRLLRVTLSKSSQRDRPR